MPLYTLYLTFMPGIRMFAVYEYKFAPTCTHSPGNTLVSVPACDREESFDQSPRVWGYDPNQTLNTRTCVCTFDHIHVSHNESLGVSREQVCWY